MATEPLLLIGAYRPEDAPVALTRLVGQWQRDGVLQRMPMPTLTKAEAIELLAALESNVAMADYLHQQSGDNPYYLTQLSDVAVDGIPATLADSVQTRLRALAEPLPSILQAGVLLERADVYEFAHPLVASVVRDG